MLANIFLQVITILQLSGKDPVLLPSFNWLNTQRRNTLYYPLEIL